VIDRAVGKGDRVRLSAAARAAGLCRRPALADREGTVVGESRDRHCLIIVWDGTKTTVSYHKDFLDRAQAPE